MSGARRSHHALGAAHEAVAGAVDGLAAQLVALRRELHAHPEPSWEEHRTTARLVELLEGAGLAPKVAAPGTGVVCDIGSHGPVVVVRGDIDALRMDDAKDVAYRSTVPGVCHACGHDLHTAAALGAGLALARVFAGTGAEGRVRLVLQPAEEAVPGGALDLIADGVMDGVRAAFALHADPSRPTGTVGVRTGPMTSAADQLRIVLTGPGGHTARPHQTTDLVHVAARLAVDLPATLSRLTDPRDGLNVTFGALRAGHAPNVVPTEAELLGSLRASGRGAWDAAPEHLPAVIAGIAEPLGATWELEHRRGAPPIENDPWAVRVVARTAEVVLGPGSVAPAHQSTGGEDFSWYGDHAPVGFFRLGVRAPGSDVGDLHSGSFDVDERAIPLGARLLAGVALEALADLSGADPLGQA